MAAFTLPKLYSNLSTKIDQHVGAGSKVKKHLVSKVQADYDIEALFT